MLVTCEPYPARFEVEEARPVYEKRAGSRDLLEPGEPAGDDTAAKIGVDNLVAVQVKPTDMQRQAGRARSRHRQSRQRRRPHPFRGLL